jgi:hypothetical protein
MYKDLSEAEKKRFTDEANKAKENYKKEVEKYE